jgi:sulfur-carrier protein
MPTVWIPAPWRAKLTSGQQQVEVTGSTVRQVIDVLDELYPGMRQRIIDPDQDRIRHDIAVSIDGEVSVGGLRHKVGDHSEIHFLPAMAGG